MNPGAPDDKGLRGTGPLALPKSDVSMAEARPRKTLMNLFTRPGTCSLAPDIALREAGIAFELVKVSRHTGKTSDGVDFTTINTKGYVPALLLDNGELLTENAALLQYIADLNPAAK